MSNNRPIPQKTASSKFINNTDVTLKDKLSQIINDTAQNISYLDFLVGYFRISGFNHFNDIIKDKLDAIKEVRILVGINLDEVTAELVAKNIALETAHNERFENQFIQEQASCLNDSNEYSSDIDLSSTQLTEAISKGTVKVRIVKEKKVHAKFYILSCEPQLVGERNGGEQYNYKGSVIIGSSNLSHNGLFKHYEFNAELRDSQDIETALYEFNQLWEKGVEITSDMIQKVEEKSYLAVLTPKELYYKMLIEHFGDTIKSDKSIEVLFPENYKALQYQVYAIQDGINKLQKYNGFFLSDVVGLGKTLIATIIAQKLEVSGNLGGKILVTCPPALKANWEDHFQKVGVNRHLTIKTHDMLHEIKDPENYGLVIVDESHRFKSRSSQRYKQLYDICKEETKYVKKVILLSATPQNNSPEDLSNQIYLFTDPRNSRIGRNKDLETFFREIKSEYKKINQELKKLDSQKDTKSNQIAREKAREKLRGISDKMRDQVLCFIMIRRTRNDIKAFFKDDLDSQGISFPDTPAPTPLEYELKEQVRDLSEQTIRLLDLKPNTIGKYGYHRYLVYPNLTPEGKRHYQEKMKSSKDEEFYEQTAQRLTGLMKSLIFKRFESSIHAFNQTLKNQIESLQLLVKMLEKGEIYIPVKNFSNLEAYYEAFEGDDESWNESWNEDFLEENKDKMMKISPQDFQPDYLKNLKTDLTTLKTLQEKWQEIEDDKEDSKLEKLIEQLQISLSRKMKDDEPKVVIFTEAQTTAKYLYKKLKERLGQYEILQIDSGNRKTYERKIRENFDANYPKEDRKQEIQILISTDTLSEGVNMHRSDTLINYDAPWNATRLMQRAGRINRIGTQHDKIFVYNFQPSNIGEEALKFTKQVYQKLQSFHYTLGEDSAVYTPDEEAGIQGIYQETESKLEDPEIPFLADILELYRENPKEFDRIKALPKKARSAMAGEEESFFYFKQATQEIHTNQDNERMEEYIGEYFYKVSSQEGSRKATRISFSDMAQNLKGYLDRTPIPLPKELHYEDAKLALEFHNEELKNTPDRDQTKKDRKNMGNLKFIITNHLFLTKEERDCLLQAIERGGYLTSKEERQILKNKANLQEIAQRIGEKMRTRETKSKIKIRYPKPLLQLSYTLTKDQ